MVCYITGFASNTQQQVYTVHSTSRFWQRRCSCQCFSAIATVFASLPPTHQNLETCFFEAFNMMMDTLKHTSTSLKEIWTPSLRMHTDRLSVVCTWHTRNSDHEGRWYNSIGLSVKCQQQDEAVRAIGPPIGWLGDRRQVENSSVAKRHHIGSLWILLYPGSNCAFLL